MVTFSNAIREGQCMPRDTSDDNEPQKEETEQPEVVDISDPGKHISESKQTVKRKKEKKAVVRSTRDKKNERKTKPCGVEEIQKKDEKVSAKKKRKTTSVCSEAQDEQPGQAKETNVPENRNASSPSSPLLPHIRSTTAFSPLYTPVKNRVQFEKDSAILVKEMQQILLLPSTVVTVQDSTVFPKTDFTDFVLVVQRKKLQYGPSSSSSSSSSSAASSAASSACKELSYNSKSTCIPYSSTQEGQPSQVCRTRLYLSRFALTNIQSPTMKREWLHKPSAVSSSASSPSSSSSLSDIGEDKSYKPPPSEIQVCDFEAKDYESFFFELLCQSFIFEKSDMDPETAVRLFPVAHKYEVGVLIQKCLSVIQKNPALLPGWKMAILQYQPVLLDDLMRGYLRTILPTSIITSLSTEWEAFTFAAEDKLNELTKILPNPTTFCYHTIVQRYMGLVSKVLTKQLVKLIDASLIQKYAVPTTAQQLQHLSPVSNQNQNRLGSSAHRLSYVNNPGSGSGSGNNNLVGKVGGTTNIQPTLLPKK